MLTSCFLSGGGSPSPGGWIDVPQFTYTGQSETIVEEGIGWKIRFLTSGTFTLLSPDRMMIDAFLVGGGGGGANADTAHVDTAFAGGGGGGGFTDTHFAQIEKDTPYEVTIGAGGAARQNGGVTTAFNFSEEGGHGADNNVGGTGGNNGGLGVTMGNGNDGASDGNPGQGTTTREFGEPTGVDYAGGGGGGGCSNRGTPQYGAGGNGGVGGGEGGNVSNTYGAGRPGSNIIGKGGNGGSGALISSFTVRGGGGGGGGNYGGGGGGGGGAVTPSVYNNGYGGAGGQGIVIIRNHRAKQATLSD